MIEYLRSIQLRKVEYRAKLRSVKTDPLTARHWHDATDPHQAARIEAAAAKRARKAEKLTHDATLSAFNNMAHAFTGQRHNSFYITK